MFFDVVRRVEVGCYWFPQLLGLEARVMAIYPNVQYFLSLQHLAIHTKSNTQRCLYLYTFAL